MIKGVNKQVLEINETENSFFEKAIFFVKPQYTGMSEGKLKERANEELLNTGKIPVTKAQSAKGRLKSALKTALPLGFGIALGAVISNLP